MLIVTLTLAVLVAVGVASYFIATTIVLSRIVRLQDERHEHDRQTVDALLDRFLARNGLAPVREPVKSTSNAVISLPIADPFEAAEVEWEREDRERFQRMTLSEDEKREIAEAAQARNVQ
jgi:hypothetical protein